MKAHTRGHTYLQHHIPNSTPTAPRNTVFIAAHWMSLTQASAPPFPKGTWTSRVKAPCPSALQPRAFAPANGPSARFFQTPPGGSCHSASGNASWRTRLDPKDGQDSPGGGSEDTVCPQMVLKWASLFPSDSIRNALHPLLPTTSPTATHEGPLGGRQHQCREDRAPCGFLGPSGGGQVCPFFLATSGPTCLLKSNWVTL